MFTIEQQALLKAVVRPKENGHYQGVANPDLDAIIAVLQSESPHLFHTEESLKERVFFNEPYSPEHYTPRKASVHPYVSPSAAKRLKRS